MQEFISNNFNPSCVYFIGNYQEYNYSVDIKDDASKLICRVMRGNGKQSG